VSFADMTTRRQNPGFCQLCHKIDGQAFGVASFEWHPA
jgi:hypothetical protein